MKVLEINGFMTWSSDYEGEHEVIRWMPRQMQGVQEAWDRSLLKDLRQGWQLWRGAKEADYEVVVCGAFGRAYGGGWLRRWTKVLWERMLIGWVLKIQRRSERPMAVIDVTDDPTIHPVNRALLCGAQVYFKRELPLDPYHCLESLRGQRARRTARRDRLTFREWGWLDKLRPIALGCREVEPDGEAPPMAERPWDVFYVGNAEVKPRREKLEEALQTLKGKGVAVCLPEQALAVDDYLQAMRDSRLALSPPGLGWDCHRHYEAAMLGSVVVTPFPVIRRQDPLLDGEHCLFYDPEKDLAAQLEEMLRDTPRLERIAAQGREHAHAHHTHRAIFDYVIRETMEAGPSSR